MSLPDVQVSSPPRPAHPPAASASLWVPIRSLGERHRARIVDHLLALDERDRYLRFGYAATDEQMTRYVEGLDFEQDEVFGIFNRRLALIAVAHLAHSVAGAANSSRPPMSEFGVSVLPKSRGRGLGGRLFEHAMLHARNRGMETLFVHALSENVAMLKIARHAGAAIERDGSETEAWLRLPPDTIASHVGEMVEHQAAEFDYRLKLHAVRVGGLLDALAEVGTSVARIGQTADD